MDIEDHFWGIEGPKSTKIPLNALIWVFSVISVLQSGFLGAWTAEYMCSKPWNKHCVQHIIVFLLFPQISPEFLTNFSAFSRSTKSQRYIASRYFLIFLSRGFLFSWKLKHTACLGAPSSPSDHLRLIPLKICNIWTEDVGRAQTLGIRVYWHFHQKLASTFNTATLQIKHSKDWLKSATASSRRAVCNSTWTPLPRRMRGGRPSAAAARRSPPRAPVDEQPAPSAPKKPDIETAEPAPAAETSDASATTSESQ